MRTILIKSSDPEFSFLLAKNPNNAPGSPTMTKALRKGQVNMGYGTDGKSFYLTFVDWDGDPSFPNRAEFEYLDRGVAESPAVICQMLTECMRSAMRGESKKDSGVIIEGLDRPWYPCTVEFYSNIPYGVMCAYENDHSSNPEEIQMLGSNLFCKVSLTRRSVAEALSAAYALCYISQAHYQQRMEDVQLMEMKDVNLVSTLSAVNRARFGIPLREVFSKKTLVNMTTWRKMKPLMDLPYENFPDHWGNVGYRDLQSQRGMAIARTATKELQGKFVMDFGCGEMSHAKAIINAFDPAQLDCVDTISGQEMAPLLDKVRHRNPNVDVYYIPLPERYVGDGPCDFHEFEAPSPEVLILSEMLEHNEKDEALKILTGLMGMNSLKQVVITVPNRNYNVVFGLEPGEFRHTDHKWEPDSKDLVEFIGAAVAGTKFTSQLILPQDFISSFKGEPAFFTVVLTKE